MPESRDRTLVKLEGGHSTVVCQKITELARTITEARQEGVADSTVSLLFIQSPQHGDNGLVIDPSKVVALIRTS